MTDDVPARHLEMTYAQACHAVQSGVKYDQEHCWSHSGEPKHLRTGLELRACDHAALVRLLVAKGVITDAEYLEAIRLETIREVIRYEDRLSNEMGTEVRLL